jgi:carbamoyl-phosphate synthase large subunit
MRTILIVNSGDGTGLNFTRCLKDAGGWRIVGIDPSLDDYHGSEADVRHLVAWSRGTELIDAINRICREHDVDLVYGADTSAELLVIAERRDQIEAITLLPRLDDHMRMEDKWLTWSSLSAAGRAVPDTVLAEAPADLEDIFDRHPKVWLRKRRGSAGAGSISTSSPAFATAWLDEHDGWGEFTAAKCLSKRTATFSGLWFEGELLRSQLRERLGWRYGAVTTSGVTGITGGQRTIHDEGLHAEAEACIRAVCGAPHGIIGVDFTFTDDGTALPTEVQPARFYSSIYFIARAGLNLAEDYCTLACDGRAALGPARLNPCSADQYWVKGVDMLPRLLTRSEYDPA